MKVLFLSFAVGLGVGVLYGLIRVKSPAPPIVALLGLLGMVLGEEFGIWLRVFRHD
jgi:XapX domain-containing protein